MIKNGKGYKPALILGGRRKYIHGSQYIVSAFSSAAVIQVGEEHSRVRRIVNIHGDLVGSKYAWVEYLGGDLFSAKRSMEGRYCDIIDARRGVLFRCLERYHPSWCAGFFTVSKNEGAMILNANGKVVCSTNRGRIVPHFGGFAWYDSLGEVECASVAVLDYRFRCVWKVGLTSPELYN
jgi:hypothetical protein